MLIALLHASPIEHSHYEALAIVVLVLITIGISASLFSRVGGRG